MLTMRMKIRDGISLIEWEMEFNTVGQCKVVRVGVPCTQS